MKHKKTGISHKEKARRCAQAEKAEKARRDALIAGAGWFRASDLAARYSVSRVTLWAWGKKGLLPPPTALGPNTKGWPLATILEFERRRSEVV